MTKEPLFTRTVWRRQRCIEGFEIHDNKKCIARIPEHAHDFILDKEALANSQLIMNAAELWQTLKNLVDAIDELELTDEEKEKIVPMTVESKELLEQSIDI